MEAGGGGNRGQDDGGTAASSGGTAGAFGEGVFVSVLPVLMGLCGGHSWRKEVRYCRTTGAFGAIGWFMSRAARGAADM